MTEPAKKPGVLDRLGARYGWFDHVMRAQERYMKSKGSFYAAGITYFTIFAIFPLLMVGFAATGFLLASQPDMLADIETRIRVTVSGDFGIQLVHLVDSAIESRTSVGVIGLATAVWAGLGWMNKLREALSQMWDQRDEPESFVKRKLSDLLAMVSTFVALLLTLGLTALGDPTLMRSVLGWFGVHDAPGLGAALRGVSMLTSWLVSWLLFTWIIARLPRESISFRSSVRAGLLAAVGFEIFKQVASIYLRTVMHGPAGSTFGPVLGLMVFAYITAQLLLFATAWAATSPDNLRPDPVAPPPPAVIRPRTYPGGRLDAGRWLTAMAVGAIGAIGLARAFGSVTGRRGSNRTR